MVPATKVDVRIASAKRVEALLQVAVRDVVVGDPGRVATLPANLHKRVERVVVGVAVLTIGRDDVVPGGYAYEEIGRDVVSAAVVRELKTSSDADSLPSCVSSPARSRPSRM